MNNEEKAELIARWIRHLRQQGYSIKDSHARGELSDTSSIYEIADFLGCGFKDIDGAVTKGLGF